MLTDIGLAAAGLVLLFVSGEGLVRGSVALAERLGLSKLVIGLVSCLERVARCWCSCSQPTVSGRSGGWRC